jgi:hypothetical protein
MKQYTKLKIVLACYAFYMAGGILSAIFEETNNKAGTIIAVALPTLVAMMCVTVLTQPRKKRLPPMQVQTTRK